MSSSSSSTDHPLVATAREKGAVQRPPRDVLMYECGTYQDWRNKVRAEAENIAKNQIRFAPINMWMVMLQHRCRKKDNRGKLLPMLPALPVEVRKIIAEYADVPEEEENEGFHDLMDAARRKEVAALIAYYIGKMRTAVISE